MSNHPSRRRLNGKLDLSGPTFSLPGRNDYLFEGHLDAATRIGDWPALGLSVSRVWRRPGRCRKPGHLGWRARNHKLWLACLSTISNFMSLTTLR